MGEFVYYNRNPEGETIGDCVIRAISLASDMDYYEVEHKLYLLSELLECDKFCICCYRYLLDDVFKYPTVDAEGYSLEQFAKLHPYGKYIVRMDGHLSTIIDGVCYDIFDCTHEILTDAWYAGE